MNCLNDVLRREGIDPNTVLVLRHTPRKSEPKLQKAISTLAAEKPILFNAYQQSQPINVEREMQRAKYIAAFIGYKSPAKTLFVGLYEKKGSRPVTREEYWQIPANMELGNEYGMEGFNEQGSRSTTVWFDLQETDVLKHLKGRLLVAWPPKSPRYPLPFRKWDRWAGEWEFPIEAILMKSALGAAPPDWGAVDPDAAGLCIPLTPVPHNTDSEGDDDRSPDRALMTTYRILRDTLVARTVKQLHKFECQICGATLILPDGSRYAEAHHIKPLGAQHNGPDRKENILCLCPNHHAELDYAIREISLASLRIAGGHVVGEAYVNYHNHRVLALRARYDGNGE